MCCGRDDDAGSTFSRGDLAKALERAVTFFSRSRRINNRNHFSFFMVFLIKPIFQKAFINPICLIHSTLINYCVPSIGLGPWDTTENKRGTTFHEKE